MLFELLITWNIPQNKQAPKQILVILVLLLICAILLYLDVFCNNLIDRIYCDVCSPCEIFLPEFLVIYKGAPYTSSETDDARYFTKYSSTIFWANLRRADSSTYRMYRPRCSFKISSSAAPPGGSLTATSSE